MHQIIVKHVNNGRTWDKIDWCATNCKGYWNYDAVKLGESIFLFEREEDAVLFCLSCV
jgi:hypothetical protein